MQQIRRFRLLYGVLLLLLVASPLRAWDSDSLSWEKALQYRLSEMTEDPLFETTQIGLMVYDLTDDSVLFQKNAAQRMRPASTEKLLTAITALSELGGAYTFQTSLFYTGQIEDSILYGDVYVKGGLDPKFGRDDLHAFVEQIQEAGIDSVAGRLVADRSFKDTLIWGKGWCWDDDEAILSPLLYQGKPRLMEAFIGLLADCGIGAPTSYCYGMLPDTAVFLGRRTHSMDQILMPMMQESDNLCAEALFYQLAARRQSHDASARDAVFWVHRLIHKMGLDPDRYDIVDGSGLSLYNYLTPELEIAFLRYAYQNDFIYLHLLPSLPQAGVSGTLKHRMRRGHPAYRKVWAKTGSVTGVSSLAGYAKAANGHLLAFCIINQGLERVKYGRDFQDRVCALLCQ